MSAANKEDILIKPVTLPPLKKSRIQLKTSKGPHAFSQQDVMVEHEHKLLLDALSQKDVYI